jgi:hypothetical protein
LLSKHTHPKYQLPVGEYFGSNWYRIVRLGQMHLSR